MIFSRRHFLQTVAITPTFVGLGMLDSSSSATEKGNTPFRLGLASYSFRNFDRAKTIEMTRRAGLKEICFKDMHLKLDSTNEQCAAAAEECKKAGMTLYGCGVVTMRTPEDVTNTFRYAKAAGMTTIVGMPMPEVLPQIEEKVKETGIYVAIHNHGPGDKMYSIPKAIMEKIGSLDKRIGLCIDVGHSARVGDDVVKSIHEFKDRVHDVHFKDVTTATPEGKECICGRGVLDLPAYLAALLDVGYDRVVSFEYEPDANDPLPGLMESVGYVRGVLRMLG